MAVLETGWKPGMKEEDAKKLVRDAIAAGIINDMGSGSNVDIAVIKPGDDITYFRLAAFTIFKHKLELNIDLQEVMCLFEPTQRHNDIDTI